MWVKHGSKGSTAGGGMPSVVEGINVVQEAGILYGQSKAASAGGVAVSGMEMSQNSARISWSEDDLQKLLLETMQGIHDSCFLYGEGKGKDGGCDYLSGANIAGFVKVADAMLAYGVQ